MSRSLPLGGRALSGDRAESAVGAALADGIAVKRPGGATLPLLRRFLEHVIVVDKSEIAAADGAPRRAPEARHRGRGGGRRGRAARREPPADQGETVAFLSGGNIDLGTLEGLLRRHETPAGRRLVLFTRIGDRPGALAGLVSMLAGTGANVVEVTHVRDGLDLQVRETGLQVVLQTRGKAHAESVTRAAAAAGYVLEWIPRAAGGDR